MGEEYIRSIGFNSSGYMVAGTKGGMVIYNGSAWEVKNTDNSDLPVNGIYYIEIDDEGNYKMGTEGGLVEFDGSVYSVMNNSNSGLSNNHIKHFTMEGEKIWFATEGGLISNSDQVEWNIFLSSFTPIPNDKINCVKIDKFGNKWIATDGGIAVYRKGGVVQKK